MVTWRRCRLLANFLSNIPPSLPSRNGLLRSSRGSKDESDPLSHGKRWKPRTFSLAWRTSKPNWSWENQYILSDAGEGKQKLGFSASHLNFLWERREISLASSSCSLLRVNQRVNVSLSPSSTWINKVDAKWWKYN